MALGSWTDSIEDPLERAAFEPIQQRSPGFYALCFAMACICFWGLNGLILHQWRHGMEVTGLNAPAFWGFYIINFVFFVGISHAGTLISAILRVTGQEWRRPITRMAEAITVFALMVGPINVFFDLGRPDRVLNILFHPHFTSPLIWDFCCITLYFIGSTTYLYLPMIPDIAMLRDRMPDSLFYRIFALGWHDTAKQRHRLEKAINFMAIAIIPVAVSVHTVISYVFAMTIKPGWHSTVFGPLFVLGAIYSGIAVLLMAMVILRKLYHFEKYLVEEHFRRLGFLLLACGCLWFYFTICEFLTTFYGQQPAEMRVFMAKWSGDYRMAFWGMVFCMIIAFFTLALPWLPSREEVREKGLGFVTALRPALVGAAFAALFVVSERAEALGPGAGLSVPPLLIHTVVVLLAIGFVWCLLPYLHHKPIASAFVASIFVIVGMWLERYVIVVPTVTNPILPWHSVGYHPTWVEVALTAFDCAGFVLLFTLFSKVFPMLPVWEMKEGRAHEMKTLAASAADHGMKLTNAADA